MLTFIFEEYLFAQTLQSMIHLKANIFAFITALFSAATNRFANVFFLHGFVCNRWKTIFSIKQIAADKMMPNNKMIAIGIVSSIVTLDT